MDRDPFADLDRWLAAERRDDAGADAAFRSVFAWVPRLEPASGFADRVLQAARAAGVLAARSPWEHAWLRLAVAAGLVTTGLAVFGLTAASPVPHLSLLVRAWVSVVAGGAAWLGRVLEVGLSVWRLCGELGAAAAVVAATPEVGLVLAANGAVALAAFWYLRRLLRPREEMVS